MAGIGVPVGIVAALLIGNVAASLLFGLTPADPLAVIAAAVVLAVSVMAASYLAGAPGVARRSGSSRCGPSNRRAYGASIEGIGGRWRIC